ncbi:hypothetical protein N7520_000180 [Penicillium odoratum]|uniref:uncharacterized protein n=1 Tax=Penicillium odoratum TaxID=1167516 RepID=UPI00254805E6|nr:uncharacterized protein N7520_000180 [Penicillium odoratum]KAJ5776934.1 hypothetical protein N7520_000180 [Penicillium odoratum]
MYESTSLDLHRLSRQRLHKRYESDEEDVSESDAGPDLVPSLVGSNRAGTIDSDLSADENSHTDPDSDREEHLLAPFPVAKRPRPVSMDTVKRSSDATFAENTRVFDPEEQMVLEIPLPESPPELDSNLYLQPAIYVSPNTPPTNRRSRSSSPSSIFSVENAEIQVARKIIMMEPPTRPTLVFINSLGSRSKGSRARPSHSRTRGNTRNRESRIFDGKLEGSLQVPRLTDVKPTSSPRISEHSTDRDGSTHTTPDLSTLHEDTLAVLQSTSATISSVSDIPVLPYFPPSPRQQPQSCLRQRPRTSGSEKPFTTLTARSSRRPTESGLRPPALRSNSNCSTPSPSFSPRPTSPFPDDQRYFPDHSEPLSRACSPASTCSFPPQQYIHNSKRGPIAPLTPSNQNIFSHRSPMMRRMTRKHSAASSISISSLRSDMDTSAMYATTSHSAVNLNTITYDSRPVRKSSQRRHARHASSATSGGSGRGFMGLKLGKRAFNKV